PGQLSVIFDRSEDRQRQPLSKTDKRRIAAAIRMPVGVESVARKVSSAGHNASIEQLQKLGLLESGPLTLLNVFRRALCNGDLNTARAAQNALWKHPVGLQVKHLRDIPLMAWHMPPISRETASQFLFVSGVARSGTTAMGNLLGAHCDVAMYIELFLPYYGYLPEMLAPQNVSMLAEMRLVALSKKNL